MFKNLFSTLISSANVQKLSWNLFRTYQEQAYHNQMDDQKAWLPKLDGLWRLFKNIYTALLYDKYDSIIV